MSLYHVQQVQDMSSVELQGEKCPKRSNNQEEILYTLFD